MASLMIKFWKRTVPLSFICVIGNRAMHYNSCLEFFLRLTRILSPTLYWWLFRRIFLSLLLWLICNCLRCQMCSYLATWLMFKISYLRNTSCIGDACTVVWKFARTANMVAARMPDHGSLLTMLETSNVRIIFPIVSWIRSMIALDWGLLVVIGFRFRP